MDHNAAAQQATKNIITFVFVKTFVLVATALLLRKFVRTVDSK